MEDRIQSFIKSNSDFIKAFQKDIIELQKCDEEPLLGDSKVGGKPDLPLDIDWPTYQGKPMTFFAQLNLEELAHLNAILPKRGWLFFFIFLKNH